MSSYYILARPDSQLVNDSGTQGNIWSLPNVPVQRITSLIRVTNIFCPHFTFCIFLTHTHTLESHDESLTSAESGVPSVRHFMSGRVWASMRPNIVPFSRWQVLQHREDFFLLTVQKADCPTTNGDMQNGSSVGICTRYIHAFAHLAPICILSRCLLTKFLRRSSVGSLLRVRRCWLGVHFGK